MISIVLRPLLVVLGFVLGAVETFLVFSSPIWFKLFGPLTAFGLVIESASSLGALVVEPIVVFVVFYIVGRRIDLQAGYLPSFIAILVGSFLGTFISGAVVTFLIFWIVPGIGPFPYLLDVIVFGSVGCLRLSLVGFAGLAFAHFGRAAASGSAVPASQQPI